jgi:hypothetical protein
MKAIVLLMLICLSPVIFWVIDGLLVGGEFQCGRVRFRLWTPKDRDE